VNCWDNYQLDGTLCQWVNTGVQPVQPSPVNCWDNYQFDAALCAWVNQGSQPLQPAAVNCWDVFVFNTATCQWDNAGSQPPAPTNLPCGLSAVFNATSCVWDLLPTTPEPTPTNCWDAFIYNTTLCSWENVGIEPQAPLVACYETAVFNTSSCSWEIQGTQPSVPATACYETAAFNAITCSWEVTGTQAEQPETECWQSATFNNASCTWEITGVPFTIEISPLALPEFAPLSTTFSLLATNAVASYEWFLDAELVSTTETFGHAFSEPGIYDVLVSAVSIGGCIATDTLSLNLQANSSQLIIPSSFTPNFDGINDLFTVVAANLTDFEMLIYNRWGELVYQTNSREPGWKGFSDNGYSYPDGTYLYRVDAVGLDGQVYHKTGSVTLFR
jgi:gliding motility-associated-like protein